MASKRHAEVRVGRRTLNRKAAAGILRDTVVSVFLIFALLGAKLWFEGTTIGSALESLGFAELQRRLIPAGLTPQPTVALIDISGIQREKWTRDGKSGECTPRNKLLSVLAALTTTRPRVIAVDIDFSPFEDGPVHPDDPVFFTTIMELAKKSGVPIFLGVDRQRFAGQEKWMGQAEFSNLAAAIAIPEAPDSRYYLRWIRGTGQSEALPSMSLVLARREAESEHVDHGPLHHYVQASQLRGGSDSTGRSGEMSWALNNYSALSGLKLEQIAATEPETILENAARFANRSVVVGDVQNFQGHDHFDIGLIHPEDLPGVFLHACGAATAQSPPLLELTHRGRVALDLIIAAVLVGLITVIRSCVALRSGSDVADSDRLFRRLVAWAIVLCVVFAAGFIQTTHVMWTDFVCVVLALVAHLVFHHPAGNLLGYFIPFLGHKPHLP